jgi:fatty acid synthase
MKELELISRIHTSTDEVLHIFQYTTDQDNNYNIIEITSNVSDWIEPLKNSLKEHSTIIYGYNHEPLGILGLMKTLSLEYKDKIKCFFIMDTENAPTVFDINDDFFKNQLKLNYSINVFKDSKWGSYRHLNIPKNTNPVPQPSHCLVDCLVKGDLSSLTWIQGPHDTSNAELDMVKIQYAPLNFKDVMLSLGRISAYRPGQIVENISNLGFEFCGISQNGDRIMGIAIGSGALATHYNLEHALSWIVPDSWTLEEAATVPLVYFTVYVAFFLNAKIKAGKTILIHSGSGGVGQAAIHTAFSYGLEVFTTVGTEDKKNFLLQKFPKLKPENIGNSRDTSFEKMIIKNTKGKGVDYVLNSLTGEKLQASIRCLGVDGVFLEIGKYDIQMGTDVKLRYLSKRITIKSIMFDDIFIDIADKDVR